MKRNILRFVTAASLISCWLVAVHGQTTASAAAPQRTTTTQRRVVKLPGAPPSRVPISPAVVAGELVFTSGQIGIDPKTGQMAATFEEQADQVLRNLSAVLEAAGSSMSHVLKATVFLADMNDYGAMNEVYGRHFKEDPPARSAVQVAKLPANAKIEIEVVAVLKKD